MSGETTQHGRHETRYDKLGEPYLKGQATEAIIEAAFLLCGIPVLAPSYDNESYDILVDYDRTFYRMQSKTDYDTGDGTVTFETVSTRSRSDGYERDGYRGKIDYFAVYSPTLEAVYLVHVDEAARGKTQLRYEEPKNDQRKGINWYESYALDAVLQDWESTEESEGR